MDYKSGKGEAEEGCDMGGGARIPFRKKPSTV